MDMKGIIGGWRRAGGAACLRLATHRRGSVLPMAAAALVPMLAMIGGAIDLSRLYMTNTRLQQACDAGALAGRRAMADVNTLTPGEASTAKSYFSFNFPTNTYSASSITANYARGAVGTVVGTASASLPMTIMSLFGYRTMTLNVSCQSTLVVPNTDVMFVLDVTGSMSAIPLGDTQSKISGLKQAVKDFYSALGPGSASGPGRVRYGFVPYSSNVNVGKIVYALNRNYIVGGSGSEKAKYQTRVPVLSETRYISSYGPETAPTSGLAVASAVTWPTTWTNQTSDIGSYVALQRGLSATQCSGKAVPPQTTPTNSGGATTSSPVDETMVYPDTEQTRTYQISQGQITRRYQYAFTASYFSFFPFGTVESRCQLQYQDGTRTQVTTATTTRTVTWQQKFLSWNYVESDVDVAPFVQNGIGANPTFFSGYAPDTNPNVNHGYAWDVAGAYFDFYDTTPQTISWNGCIEEASTIPTITGSSPLSVPSGANDLNIDLIPTDTSTRWKPFLPGLQFDTNDFWLGRTRGWIDNGYAACPREASPLTPYQSDYNPTTKRSANFDTYVDSLAAVGGTYHDIGLIWGGRFLSQDGIYAATNADSTGPGGFQISRHIVFMTDGELDTRGGANDPWGINVYQGRIAPTSTNDDGLNAIHKRRTSMICNAMKGKGFTVWVVGFGISTMPQELQDCASDAAHWSLSSNSTQLRTRFQQIAQTIGGLRLSQ
jgi:Flp pilus assembly protein TadG